MITIENIKSKIEDLKEEYSPILAKKAFIG